MLKKVNRVACFILAGIMLVALISGCGASPSSPENGTQQSTGAPAAAESQHKEKQVLTMWHWITDTTAPYKVLTSAIKEFNDTNKENVEIQYLPTPNDQYTTKINTEIAANNAPDIFGTWEAGFIKPFVNANRVYSLSDELAKDSGWKESFIPGILDSFTFNDKVYGIPLVQTSWVTFYNKDIFQKYNLSVPTTWTQFKDVISTLRKNNVTPVSISNKDLWPGGLIYGNILYRMYGKDIFNKVASGEIKFTSPEFIDAGNKLLELINLGAFPNNVNGLAYDDGTQLFLHSEAAMWIMGSWEIPTVDYPKNTATGVDNPLNGKVGYFNFPAIDGYPGKASDFLLSPDYSIAISDNCKNKQAAVEFLKLITSPKYEKQMLEDAALTPTVKVEADKSKISPIMSQLMDDTAKATDSTIYADRLLGQNTIGGEFNSATQSFFIKGADPMKIMEGLEEKIADMRDK